MDSFSLIQNFFTRMNCNYCSRPFEPEGIELIREEEGMYIVSVYCHACERQIGVAMVGVETSQTLGLPERYYPDPELTEDEIDRLADFEAIAEDDVLDAHRFFQNLEGDWTKFIPPEMLERCTEPELE